MSGDKIIIRVTAPEYSVVNMRRTLIKPLAAPATPGWQRFPKQLL
jgi:hypothetical protein